MNTEMSDGMSPVNSHNGWSPLEEVIVGEPTHLAYHDDVSYRLFFCANLTSQTPPGSTPPWIVPVDEPGEQQLREELAEDLAEFIDALVEHGVTVRRPASRPEALPIRTPEWESVAGHSVMPRDLFLVVGDELIETAPLVRSRYFETELYRELISEYCESGAKWTAAPRSRLRADNFDYGYALSEGYVGPVPERRSYEPMFDGAQAVRLGRDILLNCSTENHRLGMRWLARQLGPDYRLREINVTDNHVDSRVIPLRPGTLLLHDVVRPDQLPEFLRGWDVVRYTPPKEWLTPDAYGRRPLLASVSLGMNVLSLDEERVMVEATETDLIKSLDAAGFTPIPVRWRHGRVIGGGFHCMTLDVRRRSTLEDYVD